MSDSSISRCEYLLFGRKCGVTPAEYYVPKPNGGYLRTCACCAHGIYLPLSGPAPMADPQPLGQSRAAYIHGKPTPRSLFPSPTKR